MAKIKLPNSIGMQSKKTLYKEHGTPFLTWREKYNQVLASERWRQLRIRLISERGQLCEMCKCSDKQFEIHHLTYVRLGEERDEDLQVLCHECHKKADEQRERESNQRFRDAQFNGWVRKRYGEDYEADHNDYERFVDWANRQD